MGQFEIIELEDIVSYGDREYAHENEMRRM